MTERLSGYTTLIGLMATPIRHSLSPLMHNESFAKLGLDYAYLAFEVGNESLADAVASIRVLGMRGCNISMPNKKKVLSYLDDISQAAKLIGAVNTIVNDEGVLTGYNTDGIGFMRSLKEENINIIGKKMTMMGAGGAATAICMQAALDGVKEISIFNRQGETFENAKRMITLINEETGCRAVLYDLAEKAQLKKEIETSAILINGTSVGMNPYEGQSLINDPKFFHSDLIVADVIYKPAKTKLLEIAEASGCKTINGLGMMLYQGAAAFELWTGKEMPVEHIRKLLF